MEYTFYIHNSYYLVKQLRKDYSNELSDYDCIKLYCYKIPSHHNSSSYEWVKVDYHDIVIGDVIKTIYYPYSQRYFDVLNEQQVIGKVFYIHTENNVFNALVYNDDICGCRNIQSTMRDHVSYYGDTPGFDIVYYKRYVNVIE
jgi:hypothetical protein